MNDSRVDYGQREVPLIPGELYGMRAFRVRDDGTLGPLHRNRSFVYESGVNVAKCDDEPYQVKFTFGNGHTFMTNMAMSEVFHPNDPAPQLDCTCGFYGYFDETPNTSHMVHGDGEHVNAVVRATGRCLVGDLGFKAEKMEVVGFVANDPTTPTSKRARLMKFIIDTQTRLGDSSYWRNYVIFVIAYWATMVLHMTIAEGNSWFDLVHQSMVLLLWSNLVVILVLGIPSLIWARRQIKKIDTGAGAELTKLSSDRTKKLVKAYPDVPLFSSLKEAKEHFPISKASDLPQ